MWIKKKFIEKSKFDDDNMDEEDDNSNLHHSKLWECKKWQMLHKCKIQRGNIKFQWFTTTVCFFPMFGTFTRHDDDAATSENDSFWLRNESKWKMISDLILHHKMPM